MLRRSASLLLLSSLSLVLVTLERDAAACAPPACHPAKAAPTSGVVPAGAAALPYLTTTSFAASPAQTFRLLDPGIAEVGSSSTADPWWPSGLLLVPSAPLAPANGYHLSYNETCPVGGPAGDKTLEFDVGPSVALPTAAGALHASGRVVGPSDVPTSNGSCTSKIDTVAIDVRVVPSAELFAHARVAGYKVSVDGFEYVTRYYGEATVDANGIVVTTIRAACGARVAGDSNGPTLGVHRIGVRAHVAGATSDPPELVASFNFSCTDANVEVDGGTDAGANSNTDTGHGTTPGASSPPPGSDAGGNAMSGASNEDHGTSGCNTTPSSEAPTGALAMLGACIALVLATRRRV